MFAATFCRYRHWLCHSLSWCCYITSFCIISDGSFWDICYEWSVSVSAKWSHNTFEQPIQFLLHYMVRWPMFVHFIFFLNKLKIFVIRNIDKCENRRTKLKKYLSRLGHKCYVWLLLLLKFDCLLLHVFVFDHWTCLSVFNFRWSTKYFARLLSTHRHSYPSNPFQWNFWVSECHIFPRFIFSGKVLIFSYKVDSLRFECVRKLNKETIVKRKNATNAILLYTRYMRKRAIIQLKIILWIDYRFRLKSSCFIIPFLFGYWLLSLK